MQAHRNKSTKLENFMQDSSGEMFDRELASDQSTGNVVADFHVSDFFKKRRVLPSM
jgi:hypothetical protein